jgi:ABC-type uncharacterized transport system permease subunit
MSGSGGATPSNGNNIAWRIVEDRNVMFGFAQALLGTAATSAALHAHAQAFAQIFHGSGAITHGSVDVLLGNSLANADIHVNAFKQE